MDSGLCFECNKAHAACTKCTRYSCLECEEGFYLYGGRCRSCAENRGCAQGSCTSAGCEQCEAGFYKNGPTCAECKSRMPGCIECTDSKNCTKCKSSFLDVNPETGTCECNGSGENMRKDAFGSCLCDTDFWFTEEGCLKCDTIIPGCNKCYRTSSNTLIPLYGNATVSRYGSSRTYYLDCMSCNYGTYR